MIHANSWLYWLHNEIPMYSQCLSELITSQLHGVGIFRLMQPCTYRISELIIPFQTNALYKLAFYQPQTINPLTLKKFQLHLKPTFNYTSKQLEPLDAKALKNNLLRNSKK